ncbi:MAG: hypothetical protein WBE65_12510, partial [Steroidobacteraceae bacterium]
LRATFACMMLARLEQLAKAGAPINPLLIVKVLMGHEHIGTTDVTGNSAAFWSYGDAVWTLAL